MPVNTIARSLGCLLLTAVCACGMTPADPNDVPYDSQQEWETFRDSVYREPFEHGVFIVEGDIPISDEARLHRYFDTYVSRAAQALTVQTALGAEVIWADGAKFDLTYCISNTFGSRKTDVINGMEAATQSWSDQVGTRFRYVPTEDGNCNAQNKNVVFDVSPVTAGYFARAFFPDSERAQRNLLITGEAFTTTAGGRDFQGILRHELGHTLGFRHEHIWAKTCTSESTTDARLLTEYDVNSVMHYPQCRPQDAGGYRQTGTDYKGAISLYGLAPALIMSSI